MWAADILLSPKKLQTFDNITQPHWQTHTLTRSALHGCFPLKQVTLMSRQHVASRSCTGSQCNAGSPGGYSDYFGLEGGAPFKPQNPLHIFKSHFGRKGYPFLRIFLEKYAQFSKILLFSGFLPCKNLGSVRKLYTCLRILFVKNGTHV